MAGLLQLLTFVLLPRQRHLHTMREQKQGGRSKLGEASINGKRSGSVRNRLRCQLNTLSKYNSGYPVAHSKTHNLHSSPTTLGNYSNEWDFIASLHINCDIVNMEEAHFKCDAQRVTSKKMRTSPHKSSRQIVCMCC